MQLGEAEEKWKAAIPNLGVHFEDHYSAYNTLFAKSVLEKRIWFPSRYHLVESNWATLAKSLNCENDALWAYSSEHREQFWTAALAQLNWKFHAEPKKILGTSDPIHPDWLVGAKYNAAENAVLGDDDSVALVCRGPSGTTRITRKELRDKVAAFAGGLKVAGFSPGDAIAFYTPMNLECVIAYLGVVYAGMIVVGIPDSFAAPEIQSRLRLGKSTTVVTTGKFVRAGKEFDLAKTAREAGATRCILLGDSSGEKGDLGFSNLVQAKPIPPVSCGPYDTTNILFSSGTTGEPKAIPWVQLTPIKAAVDGRYHQDIGRGDVVAWPTNIGWMMGPWVIYASLANRATLAIYEGSPIDQKFVHFVQEERVTMLGVVPAIVRAWRERGTVKPGDFPSVAVFSNTGEASNERDTLFLMSLANYQAPVIEYCGGTEIGGGHITGTVTKPHMAATFNTPALGLDFVLLKDEQTPIKDGEEGQLFLVPPSIGLSERLLNRNHDEEYYSGTPLHNGSPLRKHGDEVMRLPGGYYVALGRADDTMNLGGIKVSSIELERALGGLHSVLESAAVAVRPKEGGADQLVLFVVPRGIPDQKQLQLDCQKAIRTHLNPLFKVHDVVVVESLPRTASNKVMRRELRKQYSLS